MGSLFRSVKMTLAQLFLQSESAYVCVRELGELVKKTTLLVVELLYQCIVKCIVLRCHLLPLSFL